MADSKMFSVDKFLGLNQSGDGDTELRMGEASRMVNFTVTDGLNLKTRPGVLPAAFDSLRTPAPILALWAGFVGTRERIVLVDFYQGADRITIYGKDPQGDVTILSTQTALLELQAGAAPGAVLFRGCIYSLPEEIRRSGPG